MSASSTVDRARTAPGTHNILFWLRWLVLACVLPAWAMTTWLIVASGLREREAREYSTVDTARALTQAVDRELAISVAGLQALATSRTLAEGDLAGFYRQAVEALPSLAGRNIVLVDPSGQELINTSTAHGSPLPRVESASQWAEAIFRTGKPAISDLFVGIQTRRPIVAIGVPVTVNGTVAYDLGMGIPPETLAEILLRQNFPANWVAAIVDSTGTFVARTHNGKQFVGKKAAASFLSQIADAHEGVFEGVTMEGVPAVAGFSRSMVSGWTVGIAIPRAELMAPLYQSLGLTIGAAAALLLLALLTAWLISWRIARSIRALSEPALALATDAPVLVPPLAIREVNEIGAALTRASRLLKERRIAREEAEQAERQSVVAKAFTRLNEAGLRLWQAQTLQDGLDEMLSATTDLLGADMGAVQLLDSGGKVLRMVAHRGFPQEFLDYFREVFIEKDNSFASALRSGNPMVIEDTELDSFADQIGSIRRAAGYRAVVAAPLINSRGKLLGILSAHFRAPHRPNDSELQRLDIYRHRAADFIERLRDQVALRESEERLRLAVTASRMGMFDWDLRTGACRWSDDCFHILGYQTAEIQPSQATWIAHIHPDDREAAKMAEMKAKIEHKEFISEYRIVRRDGSIRWIQAHGRFLYDADNPVRRIGLKHDITEARQQVETQRVLVAELQHRTRNLMAVVQSIAHQTLDTVDSFAEFEGRFNRRLDALSRVQSLLSHANNEPITLGALVALEFEALGLDTSGDKITFAGPEAPLRKSAVEMLALAIHELLTNAIKYGAFARPTGRLSVNWRIEGPAPNRRLLLEWIERGIASPTATAKAKRSGYGRTLIEEALPYSLSAETKFELGSETLLCFISLPLAENGGIDQIPM